MRNDRFKVACSVRLDSAKEYLEVASAIWELFYVTFQKTYLIMTELALVKVSN